MRNTSWGGTAALTLAVLAGCGGHVASSGDSQDAPACSKVLVVGAPVNPQGVTCIGDDGSLNVEASGTVDCNDGRMLVLVAHLWGYAGSTWRAGVAPNC